MATINPVIDYPDGDRRITRVTWTGIHQNDVCVAVSLPQWPDRTVQMYGTIGAGGTTVRMKGSNDGTVFGDINDTGGTAIAMTAAGLKVCNEVPLWIKPDTAATGDGTTNLNVIIVMRTPSTIMTKS